MTSNRSDKQGSDLPNNLSGPAQGAFAAAGITSLEQIAALSEAEILKLHGVGPKTIPTLRSALEARGLAFATRDSAKSKE
jgi:predicted flap endonuclease-1-like 5' DNA nuclease